MCNNTRDILLRLLIIMNGSSRILLRCHATSRPWMTEFQLSRKSRTSPRCVSSIHPSPSTLSPPPLTTLHIETLKRHEDKNTNRTDQEDSILFLHGLLGQGRNLKSFAKQITELTGRTAHLMDLPGHGKSRIHKQDDNPTYEPLSLSIPTQQQYSFAQCIQDMTHTIGKRNITCRTLIGHSWGGRMAVQYAYQHMESIDRVWLLDVVPGKANESVERVIQIVSKLQSADIASKKELLERLTEHEGLDMGTAQWLASSYVGPGDFGFDLQLVHDILPEFGTQDLEGMITALLESQIKVDLIRGGKNTAWDVRTLNQLESMKKRFPTLFGLHVLPKAGHWVHVDDLKSLVAIITSS